MKPSSPIRKIRHRFLRILLRVVFYTTLAAGLSSAFIYSPIFKHLVFTRAASRLAKQYNMNLTVREWDFSLWQGWVHTRDAYLTSPDSRLQIRLPDGRLEFSPGELVSGRLVPRSLVMDGVEINLQLPVRSWPENKPAGRFELGLQRLEIRRGRLILNQTTIPLEFSTGRFELTARQIKDGVDLALEAGEAGLRYQTRPLPLEEISLRATLGGQEFSVSSLHVQSPLLDIRGAGTVALRPGRKYRFDLRGWLDPALGQIYFPLPDHRLTGRLPLEIKLAGEGEGLPRLEGTIQGGTVRYRELSIQDVSVRAESSQNGYLLKDLKGRLSTGGSFQAHIELNPRERKANLSARLDNLELALLEAARVMDHPPSGNVQGTMSAMIPFNGPPAWKFRGDLAGVAVFLPRRQEYVMLEYARVTMEGTGGNIDFSIGQAVGEGLACSANGRLQGSELWIDPLQVTVPDHEAARDLLMRIARLSPELTSKLNQLEIRGSTRFEGRMHLLGDFPDVQGILTTGRTRLGKTWWDQIHLPFSLRREDLTIRQGLLKKGASRLNGSLFLELEPATRIASIELSSHELEIEPVEHLLMYLDQDLGHTPPSTLIKTRINARLRVDSPRPGIRLGSFQGMLSDLSAAGESLGSLQAAGTIDASRIQLSNLQIKGSSAELTGRGKWLTEDNRLDFQLEIRRLSLEKLQSLRKIGLRGVAEGELSLAGSYEHPVLELDLRSPQLFFQDEPFGDLTLLARFEGTAANYSLRADYRQNSYHAIGQLLLGEFPRLQSTIFLDNIQIQPFLKQFQVPYSQELTGALSGEMFFSYPLAEPQKMELEGHLAGFSLRFRDLTAVNTRPVYFSVGSQRLFLSPAQLNLNGRPVNLHGEVSLFPPSRLTASLDADFQLDWLNTFLPGITAGGLGRIRSTITGDPRNPSFSGKLILEDASLKIKNPEFPVQKINGTLDLTSQSIKTTGLTASTGYGKILLAGECQLDHFRPSRWTVTLQADPFQLPLSPDFLSVSNLHLRMAGTPQANQLSGDVWIDKFTPARPMDLVELVTAFSRMNFDPGNGGIPDWAGETRLNINLRSERTINLESNAFNVNGSASLQIKGPVRQPVVRGNIVVNQGELKFKINRFEVDRGIVSFLNPYRVDPDIQLQLSSNIKDYRVLVKVDGPASNVKTHFSSVPNLPVVDIIRLITSGDLPSPSRQSETELTNADTTAILSQLLSAALEKRLRRVTGIDTFSIDTYHIKAQSNPGARITLGKQLSRDLTVIYSRDITKQEEDLLFVEYRLSPRLTVIASRDEKGYFGLDFKFKKQLR